MLKKLTATGILVGAATGAVLLGAPAHADRIAAGPSTVSDIPSDCYARPGYVPPAWCANYVQNPYYPPAVYPPTTYYTYPRYGYGWHHGWGGYPHYWHR